MPGRNHCRDSKLEVIDRIHAGLHTTAHRGQEHALASSLTHQAAQRSRGPGRGCVHRRDGDG